MLSLLQAAGWMVCVVYSTIPCFWLAIHPRADFWRQRSRSPYFLLLPAWLAMWIAAGEITAPWRHVRIYVTPWSWLPAVALFAFGFSVYVRSGKGFSAR